MEQNKYVREEAEESASFFAGVAGMWPGVAECESLVVGKGRKVAEFQN
ncbi:hypothetical protein [Halalkalibacter alkalisediminis]|uniref:Uncharacterized protein n=1 Tax=Halalkalibacter alkalisediminis TaxID=935616 RepID=A0ABV6NJY7_9BACI|nr:hypothetical protein [Halalkalibacter alkalisediminis]